MLVRPAAARQILPVRHLLSSSPLRLSSRCCVATNLARPQSDTRRLLTSNTDSRSWKNQKSFRALDGFERNLATAVEEHRFGDEVPFEGLPASLNPPLYELQPFDVSSPLMLSQKPPYPERQRANGSGIPGDLDELLSIFEACVHVGRMDRASLILKRLLSMGALSPEREIAVHNRYLQGRVAQLSADPDTLKGEHIHEWFELNIQDRGLPFTPLTLACMLKTTLLTSRSVIRHNRIDRYMSMMPLELPSDLDMGNVLDDDDLAAIAAICPAYSVPEHPSSSAEAAIEGAEDLETSDQSPTPSDGIPQVLSTPQKGLGLASLKSTLTLFSELPEGFDIASLPIESRREIQERLERDCVDAAIDRWREDNQKLADMGLNTQMGTPSLNSKLFDWHQALEARLVEEQAKVEMSELAPKKSVNDLDRCVYGPLLLQSTPSRLAAVTVLSVLSLFAMNGADKGVPVGNCVIQVGKLVEEDIRVQKAAGQDKLRNRKTTRQLMRARGPVQKDPASPVAATGSASQFSIVEAEWPTPVRAKVGTLLVAALIESARIMVTREHPDTKEKITQSQPAFTHGMQLKRGKKVGVVLPNRNLVEMLKREPRGEALARHLPMVVEPEPWTKFEHGGFVSCPTPIIRLKNHELEQKYYAEAAIERGDMEQMMRGLDVLGKTAWRINRPVFEVMLQAWNTGEEFANFPPVDPKVDLPPEPESTEDPMMKRQWIKELRAAEYEKSGMHSVRCFINFQLEIARAFRDQTFYFPHNVDFRGRAYPMPTYLNHMGADHMRGLLVFAKGKPLGEKGLRWLKVHLANVYGFDKASLEEREKFATDNWENILDSAEHPLTGNRWWLKAEDAWQCLATCFELRAALQSPDPAAYVSHLPVHQDGTCNGLQHYAALGGDTWGAQQVNLIPGERPADVYSAVARLVQDMVSKDKEEGNDFAAAVDGKITRKVVKQTVMTNVYGVTYVGAKKQVQKQLDSLYPDLARETGISPRILSAYIASKIFLALSTMFRGAHDIQDWLGEICNRVCQAITPEQVKLAFENPPPENPRKKKRRVNTAESGTAEAAEADDTKKRKPGSPSDEDVSAQFRNTLVWTTPLRMPVVQPYRKTASKVIKTVLQDLALTCTGQDDPVNRRKQLQAFPPNFIHSLDASHMMLSALECDAIGLTFAAVHDSFWTHAADIDSMNRVLRDAFIRIHSEDVIGRLKSEFEARYRNALYRAKVVSDQPVAKAISKWRRKERSNLNDEILLEMRRQELLRSIDPEEVRQGKEMVTPASIFESMATPDQVVKAAEDPEEMAADDADADADADPETGELAAADEAPDAGLVTRRKTPTKQSYDKDIKDIISDNSSYFGAQMKIRDPKQAPPKHQIALWLPLTLPDIPQKGDFDVTQLRESKYFFS